MDRFWIKNKLLDYYRVLRDRYLFFRRYKYLNQIKQLIGDETCIISSNCFAGRILQDLKKEYNTPTLGLYFWAPDFIEFCSNLSFYLTADIEFVEHSKYPLGNQRREAWTHWYPIGLLGGVVEIHFLHYHSEEEAREKWKRRVARVNLNNLMIIGMDQNLGTEKELYAFDQLPYENKIYFSRYPDNLESNEFMPEFKKESCVGDAYKKGHFFYKHLVKHFSK